MNILLIHITIAICSIILLTLSIVKPTKSKIYFGYGLITATLVSGTYLVMSTNSPIKSSCISGLTYVAIATVMTFVAQKRLSHQQI